MGGPSYLPCQTSETPASFQAHLGQNARDAIKRHLAASDCCPSACEGMHYPCSPANSYWDLERHIDTPCSHDSCTATILFRSIPVILLFCLIQTTMGAASHLPTPSARAASRGLWWPFFWSLWANGQAEIGSVCYLWSTGDKKKHQFLPKEVCIGPKVIDDGFDEDFSWFDNPTNLVRPSTPTMPANKLTWATKE